MLVGIQWVKNYFVVFKSFASGARLPGFEPYLYDCGRLKTATNAWRLFMQRWGLCPSPCILEDRE